MIQLKSLIKEEVLNENMVSVLKPPVRKAKSTIYGYINLQYHAVPLIKSMKLVDCVKQSGLIISKSEIRRLIKQGAVKINDNQIIAHLEKNTIYRATLLGVDINIKTANSKKSCNN